MLLFETDFFKSNNLTETGKLEKNKNTTYISKRRVKGKWVYSYDDTPKRRKKIKSGLKETLDKLKETAEKTQREREQEIPVVAGGGNAEPPNPPRRNGGGNGGEENYEHKRKNNPPKQTLDGDDYYVHDENYVGRGSKLKDYYVSDTPNGRIYKITIGD